MIFRLNENT